MKEPGLGRALCIRNSHGDHRISRSSRPPVPPFLSVPIGYGRLTIVVVLNVPNLLPLRLLTPLAARLTPSSKDEDAD